MNGVAIRRWWRVSTRLDGLLRDDLITSGGWQAAADFRRDYEKAGLTGQSVMASLGMGSRASHDDRIVAGRLDAIMRLRLVKARIGGLAYALCTWVAAEDLPWCEVGARIGVSDKTARLRAAKAIELLAEG